MASIVIRGSCVQPLEKKEKEGVHTQHAQEEQCNACAVECTVLGQDKSNMMTCILDPRIMVVGHYTNGQHHGLVDHECSH